VQQSISWKHVHRPHACGSTCLFWRFYFGQFFNRHDSGQLLVSGSKMHVVTPKSSSLTVRSTNTWSSVIRNECANVWNCSFLNTLCTTCFSFQAARKPTFEDIYRDILKLFLRYHTFCESQNADLTHWNYVWKFLFETVTNSLAKIDSVHKLR